ncbi:MAG: DinB family protein [Acidobacteria bacterium]|nr:DinB family protein [Acidobacteriota bacterium]
MTSEEVLRRLGRNGEELQDLTDRLPEGRRPSALPVVVHMELASLIYNERAFSILSSANPTLRSFYRDPRVTGADPSARTWREWVDSYLRSRRELLEVLRRVPLPDWERFGTHERHGRMTLHEVLCKLAEHEAPHLDQLRGLAAP